MDSRFLQVLPVSLLKFGEVVEKEVLLSIIQLKPVVAVAGPSRSVITVAPGNTFTFTVGAGATTTAAGGDSWFGSATTVMAKGGNSVPNATATGATGGAAASGFGTFKFNGGNGANATDATFGGGGGSSAGTAAAGNFTNTTTRSTRRHSANWRTETEARGGSGNPRMMVVLPVAVVVAV